MSIRSRFQSPPAQPQGENPNLQPRKPQVDPFGPRGRFQQAALGAYSAEERTRVPLPQTASAPDQGQEPKVVKKEETTTTVVDEDDVTIKQ